MIKIKDRNITSKSTWLKPLLTGAAAAFMACSLASAANVTVSSIADLRTYAAQDGNNVTMTPGDYYILKADRPLYENEAVVEFSGDNNTFNFDGAKFYVETSYYDPGEWERIFRISGDNNLIKDLHQEDTGDTGGYGKNTGYFGGVVLVYGGVDNVVDNFYTSYKGSSPYGYGDWFGKGSSGTLFPMYKKCGVLIQGENCTFRNSTIIGRSFGHLLFMQGAVNTTIEGCYIEGVLRDTNDILAETSGAAYDLDFYGANGTRLPADETIALVEAGIRCYSTGSVEYLDGITRNTDTVTVIDCVVTKAREGITLGDVTGTLTVTGCDVTDCESGYQITQGTITNSSGNYTNGPLFARYATRHQNGTVTLTAKQDEPVGNTHSMAYVISSGLDLTILSDGEETYGSDLPLLVGGEDRSIRDWGVTSATNNSIINLTSNPVIIDADASSNDISSIGRVSDSGTGNTITMISQMIPGKIEAENDSAQSGTNTEDTDDANGGLNVGWIGTGDYLDYDVLVDAPGDYNVSFRVAAKSSNIKLDLKEGSTVLTSLDDAATGSYQTWKTVTKTVNLSAGETTLRVLATGGGWNLNWIDFEPVVATVVLPGTVEAENYIAMSGIQTEGTSDIGGGDNVGWIDNGDYLDFNISAPQAGDYDVSFRVASSSNNIKFDLKNGNTVLTSVNEATSGGWQSWKTVTKTITLSEGTTTLRILATGSGWNINWMDLVPNTPSGVNLVLNGNGSTSSSYSSSYNAAKALDGNTTTRWAAKGESTPWLIIDFGTLTTFNQTSISDYGNRVTGYKIQYYANGSWNDAFTGGNPANTQVDSFDTVVGSKVRLQVTSSTNEPSFYEFAVYNN